MTRGLGPVSKNFHAIEIAGMRAHCDPSGALFFPSLSMLVVSDLHLEKASAFARRGMLLPPYDTVATLSRLGEVIRAYRPEIVVSLGDSFHDDGGPARLPDAFRQMLVTMMAGRQWFWVTGNHDPSPPQGLPGTTATQLSIAGLVLRHEPTVDGGAGEIAGHLHPGARLVRSGRSVRRACFASDGQRLVMPAFGSLAGTLNVLDRAYAGLFAPQKLTAYMLGRARVYPVAGSMLSPA